MLVTWRLCKFFVTRLIKLLSNDGSNQLAHTMEDDVDLLDKDLTARESEHIQQSLKLAIPPLRGPDVLSKPFGVGMYVLQALNFSMLIERREMHETSQAKNRC